jgi:hypothetical protein
MIATAGFSASIAEEHEEEWIIYGFSIEIGRMGSLIWDQQ